MNSERKKQPVYFLDYREETVKSKGGRVESRATIVISYLLTGWLLRNGEVCVIISQYRHFTM